MLHNISQLKVPINKQLALKPVKKKVAVIVCYRDSGNGTRKHQKDLFIKIMSNLLPCLFDVHIYIIEQSKEGLFNIGKLKNMALKLLVKMINMITLYLVMST